jgi:hypothetical protein
MASSTGSKINNTALEACDMPCVPEFKKNANHRVTKTCDESFLDSARCHLETPLETRFYNAINWNVLTETINTSMGYFVEELNNNAALASLIQKAYKFGPVRNASGATVRRFGRLGFRVLNNEHFRFCKNLIIKITLESAGGRTQDLSHISLHPKLPFYHRDTRRSRSGCGYYKKKDVATASGDPRGRSRSPARGSAAAGRSRSRSRSRGRSQSLEGATGTGAFHYKVDTLYWRDKPFHFGEKHIPFMEFHPDPEKIGFFLEEMGDFRKDISRHEIIIEKRTAKKLADSVALELKSLAIETAKKELGEKAPKKREMELYKELLSKAVASMPEPEAASDDEGTLSRDKVEQIDTLNRVHKGISHLFLEFWNQKLLRGVEKEKTRVNQVNQYPGFPAILRSSEGGKRRTRRNRH